MSSFSLLLQRKRELSKSIIDGSGTKTFQLVLPPFLMKLALIVFIELEYFHYFQP